MIVKTRQKTEDFISDLSRELGSPENKNKTRALLKAILHSIRDNITLDHSIYILTQLPPFLKEVYVDNWKPSQSPSFMNENINIGEEVQKRVPDLYKKGSDKTEREIYLTVKSLEKYIQGNPPEFLSILIPDAYKTKESTGMAVYN